MPETAIGKTLQDWSPSQKAEMKADLEKLTRISHDILYPLVEKIAKTYPACNVRELVALEAEKLHVTNAEELSDALSSWTYMWSNISHDSPKDVCSDLLSLGLISTGAGNILMDSLQAAVPFRETALAVSAYLRVGARLFVSMKGVIDLRCRFHRSAEEFALGRTPTEVIDYHPVIMTSMVLHNEDDEESTVSFLMDENDLAYLKRFVENIEKELDLSKRVVRSLKKND